MNRRTLYTAVGHFKEKTNGPGKTYPVILINRKEFLMDIQEMTVWTALCWRLLDFQQLQNKYEQLSSGLTDPKYTLESCVERLKTRGLIACGTGDTDIDALYDLLGSLYVAPLSERFSLRMITFLKLVASGVPVKKARILFRQDCPDAQEARIMALSRQALLSTAELIKCMDVGASDVSTGAKLMDALYCDPDTSSDNICYQVQNSKNKIPVTMSVANLYLRKQIIFERV